VDASGPLRAPDPTTAAGLAAAVRAAPPQLGSTRLVCIDGPAGSGKTTLAGRLAAALGDDAAVVHMDDIYAGWTLTGAAARLAAGVLGPLSAGRPGAYHRYDWIAAWFDDDATPVPVAQVLIVEGCGSCPRLIDPWATLRIWVEAPASLRLARGLARDGEELAAHWRRWQREERALFEAEDTRARADLRVDGAPSSTADDVVVLLDDTSLQRAARTMDA
jgi:uridine kinase